MVFFECACAVSTTTTSTPASRSASTRRILSSPTPTAAPTRRRPFASLHESGKIELLLDVLVRDEPFEAALAIDDGELLDAVLVQNLLRPLEGDPLRGGDEILRGHHLVHLHVVALEEAQVAARENADENAVLRDGKPRDPEFLHHLSRLAHELIGRQGDGVRDHAALAPLHAVDVLGLLHDGEILVDDAHPALAGEGDREARFGHRVHRRGDDRDVETDRAGQPRSRVRFSRENARFAGDEENVVEREPFLDNLGFIHLRRKRRRPFLPPLVLNGPRSGIRYSLHHCNE